MSDLENQFQQILKMYRKRGEEGVETEEDIWERVLENDLDYQAKLQKMYPDEYGSGSSGDEDDSSDDSGNDTAAKKKAGGKKKTAADKFKIFWRRYSRQKEGWRQKRELQSTREKRSSRKMKAGGKKKVDKGKKKQPPKQRKQSKTN